MRIFFLLLSLLLPSTSLLAQEGHPLVGTWHGTWGADAKSRSDVTVVLFWDGKTVTGMVNPGPDSIKLENANLEPEGWKVHFEGNGKDKAGKPVRVVVDAKIENVTNVRRTIVGTWKEGSTVGDVKLTRDN
jgi:hypothetical protein